VSHLVLVTGSYHLEEAHIPLRVQDAPQPLSNAADGIHYGLQLVHREGFDYFVTLRRFFFGVCVGYNLSP
jgi:hypothetical protein